MTTLDHRPDLPTTRLRTSRHPLPPRTRSTVGTTELPSSTPTGPTRNPTTWERNGDRRDRLHLALSELFVEREDLTGVSAVADVLSEDLLWSV